MKKIAIIIPTFNRCNILRVSLKQLQEQIQKNEKYEFKIVVVNDGCTDGTEDMLDSEFSDVLQVKTPGDFWYTKSMNFGFKEALKLQSDYILTLNDDIEFRSDYIYKITEAIFKYNEPVVMGSLSVAYNNPNRITFSGVSQINWWRFKQHTYHKYLEKIEESELTGEYRSELLPGRGMLIDIRIMKDIGFFEPKLIQYASDDEFCYRAIRKGYKVYVSWDSVIYSHHEMTGDGTPQLKQSMYKFVKSFFNQYSRNYWKKHFLIIWKYGIKILFPVTISIIFLGEFYSYFKYRFSSES